MPSPHPRPRLSSVAVEFLKAKQHSQQMAARLEECVFDSWQSHVMEDLNSPQRNSSYPINLHIPEQQFSASLTNYKESILELYLIANDNFQICSFQIQSIDVRAGSCLYGKLITFKGVSIRDEAFEIKIKIKK